MPGMSYHAVFYQLGVSVAGLVQSLNAWKERNPEVYEELVKAMATPARREPPPTLVLEKQDRWVRVRPWNELELAYRQPPVDEYRVRASILRSKGKAYRVVRGHLVGRGSLHETLPPRHRPDQNRKGRRQR